MDWTARESFEQIYRHPWARIAGFSSFRHRENDHYAFDQANHPLGAVQIHHDTWNLPGSHFGDASLAAPSSEGTADNMFYEDCTFTNPNGSAFCFGFDGWMGSRMVVRHCTLTNS